MAKSKKTKKAAKKVAKSRRKVGTPTKASGKSTLGTPYGDNVLVRPEAVEQTTAFGIIIPDTAKEKPETGVVVAVGEGRTTDEGGVVPMRVKVGDKIMFSKYGFDEITIAGKDYYLIPEKSIKYIF